MELLLLVLINIIMGTIFYLIIRLKLERSASDYREKRLKREIDEIISEFNAVAERNISILESRISYFKGLLEKSGDIKSIDINIDDNGEDERDGEKEDKLLLEVKTSDIKTKSIEEKINKKSESIGVAKGNNNKEDKSSDFQEGFKGRLSASSDRTLEIIKQYKNSITNFIKEKLSFPNNSEELQKNDNSKNDFREDIKKIEPGRLGKEVDIVLKDDVNIKVEESVSGVNSAEGKFDLSEGEISDMFLQSDDKYTLISELHVKGYPTNIITKCSGLPSVEVKLVLDLNDSA